MPLVSSSSASSSHLSQSEMEGNTGPGRRTLSNPSSANPGISIRQASSDSNDVTSLISPSGSTPRSSNPLLDIASVPPVDIDNPSIHPPHELKIVYPQQDGNATPTSPNSSSNNKIIPVNEDILLPFVDRPTEVKELLESEPRNRGLFERLQEVFTPHPAPFSSSTNTKASQSLSSSTTTSTSSSDSSHNKQTWQDISSILYAPRDRLTDQEWIDSLKNAIFPKSTALWERLRACLGIDVDDEQGTDRFEELSSDFNPDPLGAGALLMNNGGTTSTGGEGTSAPGLGMGMGLAHSHSSSGEVFSLTSPPKIPPPSLSDDMLSPRAVLRTHGSGNNTGIIPMAIPGTNQNLNAINQGLKMSPSAPAAGFGNNSPYASAGVSPAPSPSLGAPGGSSAAQGTRSIPIPNSGGDGSRSPSKANVGNNHVNPAGGGGESTRMHRRTSSGGSSFRRSFAMSSISEDAPVVDFGPPSSTSSSGGPSTPLESNGDPYGSNSLSSSLSEDTMNNGSGAGSAGGVDLGNLLRLKGHSLDAGNGHANASSNANPAQQIQAFHQQQQHQYQHHPSLQGSALSIGSASSFTPSSFGNSLGMSGHSFAHGQALPSPSNHPSSFNQNTASGGGGTLTHSSSSSSLGLSVDPHHHQQQQQAPSPSLSRSPSWNLGSAANPNRLSGSGGLAGGLSSSSFGNNFMPSSPSFNSTYNKRAYDEYNPVFESDDGSSVAGSVRSTGRGPGVSLTYLDLIDCRQICKPMS